MGIIAAIASALYWPGTLQPVTIPRWAFLATMALLVRPQRITAAHAAGLVFLGWAVLSVLWMPYRVDTVQPLFVFVILGCCFCVGNQVTDLRPVYIGAALGLTVSSVIACIQFFGWHPLYTITPIAGLFVNGDFMAEAAALVIVALVAERLWYLVPGLLPALLLPSYRGAGLAVAATLALHYRQHWRVLAVLGLIGAGVVAWYIHTKGLFSINDRLAIWQSGWDGITFFGHGIGSIWSVFPTYDVRHSIVATPEFLHDEFLQVGFELGVVGLVIFMVFCLTFVGPLDTPRLVMVALAISSLFGFPLHWANPAAAFFGSVVAGYSIRNRYLLCDVVMRRAGIGEAWLAGAGQPQGYGVFGLGRSYHAVRSFVSRVPTRAFSGRAPT